MKREDARRVRIGHWHSCLLLSAVVSLSGHAQADNVADEAELHFSIGTASYRAGDYRHALEEFIFSQRLVPNRNVLFNVARCYELLGQFPDAYRYFDQSLSLESDAKTRSELLTALARVSRSVAVLDVRTEPPGATLYIERHDLGSRGTSPQRLGVTAGRYRVIAELAGYHPVVYETQPIHAGEQVRLDLPLEPLLGRIRLDAPRGTRFEIRGENVQFGCEAPCESSLAPGLYTVQSQLAQHQLIKTEIKVQYEQLTSLVLAPPPLLGVLEVVTDEPGARIEVDERFLAFTPAALTLPVGEHSLRVSLAGFATVSRSVIVSKDEPGRVELALVEEREVEGASRRKENVDNAPNSVSIVDRTELRTLAYPTVAEALRGLPGVVLWDDRAYVGLGLRGISRIGSYGNRLLVMHDGIPTNDDWLGSSFSDYDGLTDLGDVERIELVHGPGAATYGTGAVSGVVNIVSRPAKQSGVELALGTAPGAVSRARIRGNWLGKSGANVWTSLSLGHSQGRDFYIPEYLGETSMAPGTEAGHARGLDGSLLGTLRGRAQYGKLSANWYYHARDKHIPGAQYDVLFGDKRTRQLDRRGFFELRAEPQLTPTLDATSRVALHRYAFNGYYPRRAGVVGGLETDTYRSTWVTAEQRLRWVAHRRLALTLGASYENHFSVEQSVEDGNGYILDQRGSNGRPFRTGATYAMVDAQPGERHRVSLGARLDAYSTFGMSLSPRVTWLIHPYAAGHTRFLVARAFRAPSVYELYYNDGGYTQVANPDLRPEVTYSAELAHSHRFSPTVMASATLFTTRTSGLIDLVPVSTAAGAPLQFQSAVSPLVSTGLEAELRRDWRQGWLVAAAYSHTIARYVSDDRLSTWALLRADTTRRHVFNAPIHMLSLKGAAPLIDRRLTAASRITVEDGRWDRYENEGDLPQRRTSPAVLWDVVLTGKQESLRLDYSFGVYNLLDWQLNYPVGGEFRQRTMPALGRSLLASLQVTL